MKIFMYEVRQDEEEWIDKYEEELGVEVVRSNEVLSMENIHLVQGCKGVSILGHAIIDRQIIDELIRYDVRFLSTRTIGVNHIDLKYAKEKGLRVCNANYEPNGVAEFAVMLMLMSLRHYKQAIWRGQVNDFSLNGLLGKEMKDLTVGVLGTGNIGAQVIKILSGFGCEILAYDLHKNPAIEGNATYTDLNEIYQKSDIITLHLPLLESTFHIIDDEAIAKMKEGVILINCARGELAETESLIKGVESMKIGALGIDCLEGEEGIIHEDHRIDILPNRDLFYLRQFRNVIMTQHMAFYTDVAVESMVRCGLEGIYKMVSGETCITEFI